MEKCSCGNIVKNLTSYFDKESKMRITVCSTCASSYDFNNKDKWYSVPYDKITEEQNKTPEPNVN